MCVHNRPIHSRLYATPMSMLFPTEHLPLCSAYRVVKHSNGTSMAIYKQDITQTQDKNKNVGSICNRQSIQTKLNLQQHKFTTFALTNHFSPPPGCGFCRYVILVNVDIIQLTRTKRDNIVVGKQEMGFFTTPPQQKLQLQTQPLRSQLARSVWQCK